MFTMSLRARILTLVAGFIVMALAIMLFGLASLSAYNRMMTDYGRAYENAYMGERLNHMITASLMETRGLYLSKSAAEDQRSIHNTQAVLVEAENTLAHWQAEKTAPPRMQLDSLATRVRAFIQVRYQVLDVVQTQSKLAGETLGLRYRPEREALQNDLERVADQTRQTLAETKAKADTFRHQRMLIFALVTLAWITVTALLTLWVILHFITREITRIRIEDAHRETLLKQLLETNTELERFAYVASHDMQEPIRMVNIYSQMIARDYDSQLDDTGRQYLGVVTTSASRMHGLVQDLLQYSRLQHDHARPETVDLTTQLDHVRGNFTKLIDDTGAVIEAHDLPQVNANPVQVQRLLGNLIANAIKYQPPGQTPHITLTATDLGDQWQITVADNGLGVDPHFATQIFEPFRRLHTWDQYEGSGMGLAICRKIVDRHGGRIWVDPAPGQGATFHFTLPRAISLVQAVRRVA